MQAVNHPYLVVHSSNAPSAPSASKDTQRGLCTICRDPLEDGIAAGCGHAFCRACITEYMETATGTATCVACDKPITIDLVNAPPVRGNTWMKRPEHFLSALSLLYCTSLEALWKQFQCCSQCKYLSLLGQFLQTGTSQASLQLQAVTSRVAGSSKDSIVNRISLANFQSSTKIEALREELDRMLQRDPSGKAIVFSQFTSMLDLIAFRLQQVSCPILSLFEVLSNLGRAALYTMLGMA